MQDTIQLLNGHAVQAVAAVSTAVLQKNHLRSSRCRLRGHSTVLPHPRPLAVTDYVQNKLFFCICILNMFHSMHTHTVILTVTVILTKADYIPPENDRLNRHTHLQ